MGEDIVERLKQADQMQEGRGSGLYKEAAAEIVNLRNPPIASDPHYHFYVPEGYELKAVGSVVAIRPILNIHNSSIGLTDALSQEEIKRRGG